MHELTIAEELYRWARWIADQRGGGRLQRVRAAVGERAGVNLALLQAGWRVAVGGTADCGAELAVDWRIETAPCQNCGSLERRLAGHFARCANCGRLLDIHRGRELDVVEVDTAPSEITVRLTR